MVQIFLPQQFKALGAGVYYNMRANRLRTAVWYVWYLTGNAGSVDGGHRGRKRNLIATAHHDINSHSKAFHNPRKT